MIVESKYFLLKWYFYVHTMIITYGVLHTYLLTNQNVSEYYLQACEQDFVRGSKENVLFDFPLSKLLLGPALLLMATELGGLGNRRYRGSTNGLNERSC